MTVSPLPSRFLASLVAVFGEFDISGDLEKKRSVTKNVKHIVVHREYDAATFENDLALLELESPIHYDTHIGELLLHSILTVFRRCFYSKKKRLFIFISQFRFACQTMQPNLRVAWQQSLDGVA